MVGHGRESGFYEGQDDDAPQMPVPPAPKTGVKGDLRVRAHRGRESIMANAEREYLLISSVSDLTAVRCPLRGPPPITLCSWIVNQQWTKPTLPPF